MIKQLFGPDQFDLLPHLVPLGIAYLLALPIGWDREQEERSAGLRTFPLVAVAACGFVQAGESALGGSPDAMSKVIEGLITGIGFIGGGAILRLGASVRGTATAASLWATGAIGVATGLGSYDLALILALFTVLSFKLLMPLKAVVDAERDSLDRPDDADALTDSAENAGDRK